MILNSIMKLNSVQYGPGSMVAHKYIYDGTRPKQPAPAPSRLVPSAPPFSPSNTTPQAATPDITSATRDGMAVSSPIINELLCFVANKTRSMPYNMLLKLCEDFYKADDIACARDMLFNISGDHHSGRKRNHRGEQKAHRDMEDIMNIFLELPLHAVPEFVCKDISNLPPLSMNNFDMASVIRSIETLQEQVKLLTENQAKCTNAQVTLCNHLIPTGQGRVSGPSASQSGDHAHNSSPAKTIVNTPTITINSTPSTPVITSHTVVPAKKQHRSIFSDEDESARENSSFVDEVTPDRDSDSEGNNRDLIRLATIQNRSSQNRSSQHRSSHNRLSQNRSSQNRSSQKPHNNRAPGSHRLNMNTESRNESVVITGNGSSTHIRASRERTQRSKRECVGIFISRMSRSTKARHVDRHIEAEARISVHCEEIPSKYDNATFRSFFVRLSPRNQKKLMNANMWPLNTIVRGYYE